MTAHLSKAALATAAAGTALTLSLTACASTSSPNAAGSASASATAQAPSPMPSADPSGTPVTNFAQACMAIESAAPSFQSAYQSATTVHGKALAVADFAGTVAAVIYDLSRSAVNGTATGGDSQTLSQDAQDLVNMLKTVSQDLNQGNEAGAGSAVSGQLQSSENTIKADCGD